eukprot:CAMPEP_0174326952 /NCGR_PEP_ID=MMETSP0810-20121108/14218_1 /TAXON_ID=73025 ORGANISM="Eutreptiella gymnastica-like, Strain CCMP1594" /NCGR_SAMPLE_ID=MMETSP0810 /ASSEMBLY_ACC=CAM_ASM_000659 /LENGTH=99 /DNA_ID=CAMNT_0015440687 /DNA_START=536 /DNA_END=835 /DNA_ORIENTATION=+
MHGAPPTGTHCLLVEVCGKPVPDRPREMGDKALAGDVCPSPDDLMPHDRRPARQNTLIFRTAPRLSSRLRSCQFDRQLPFRPAPPQASGAAGEMDLSSN